MAQWVAFVSVGVGECQSEDSLVCFGAKPTQRACTWDFQRDQKKMREGKVPGQPTEESSQQKSGEGNGQRETAAKWGARICGLRGRVGQCERMSQRSWWLWRNFAWIHTCDNPQNDRKVSKTSPFLCLELTQVHACLFFFSSTFSVVYIVSCVFVKQCEMFLVGDERNH